MAEASPLRYRAFLSYSHRDTAWGKWLHGGLESYRIDNDLIGRSTSAGPVPKSLRPIFRDREDFSAGHSLQDQTIAALEASQFLVVLCSPNAARSQYVNEEIRRYKAFGRADYVIPVIIDGEPGDAARECFPPALKFKVGPDGALTTDREEPIAADARPQGDGKDIAKLKVVAGLLGIGLDEIVRREERARRRRLRNWVGALGMLTLTFAGLAVWAEINRREAVAQRQYAEQALDAGIRTSNSVTVGLAARFRNRAGIQSGLVKYILDEAQTLQDKLTSYGRSTPDLQRSKATALLETELTLATIGDNASAFAAADKARQIYRSLLADQPNDAGSLFNVALGEERVADVLLAQGKRDEALATYKDALAAVQSIVDTDPTNSAAQDAVADKQVKIGDVLLYENKADQALPSYQASLALREKLVAGNPDDASLQRGLGISEERLGDALLTLKKPAEALAAFQTRLKIAQALADRDADDTELQRELSVAYNKMADADVGTGTPEDVLAAYQKSLAIRQKLADSDPGNTLWQRDLATNDYKIGGVLAAAGKLDAALTAYQQGLAILRRLSNGDPSNAQWQRDQFMTDLAIANVFKSENKTDAALGALRASLAVAEGLVTAHPEDGSANAALQFSITQIGLIAYRLVVNHQFALGLQAVEQCIARAPDLIWLNGVRAHALMFLDRSADAQAIYLQFRGRKNVWNQASWEDFIKSAFADLRKAGLENPLMDEIEKQFADGGP